MADPITPLDLTIQSVAEAVHIQPPEDLPRPPTLWFLPGNPDAPGLSTLQNMDNLLPITSAFRNPFDRLIETGSMPLSASLYPPVETAQLEAGEPSDLTILPPFSVLPGNPDAHGGSTMNAPQSSLHPPVATQETDEQLLQYRKDDADVAQLPNPNESEMMSPPLGLPRPIPLRPPVPQSVTAANKLFACKKTASESLSLLESNQWGFGARKHEAVPLQHVAGTSTSSQHAPIQPATQPAIPVPFPGPNPAPNTLPNLLALLPPHVVAVLQGIFGNRRGTHQWDILHQQLLNILPTLSDPQVQLVLSIMGNVAKDIEHPPAQIHQSNSHPLPAVDSRLVQPPPIPSHGGFIPAPHFGAPQAPVMLQQSPSQASQMIHPPAPMHPPMMQRLPPHYPPQHMFHQVQSGRRTREEEMRDETKLARNRRLMMKQDERKRREQQAKEQDITRRMLNNKLIAPPRENKRLKMDQMKWMEQQQGFFEAQPPWMVNLRYTNAQAAQFQQAPWMNQAFHPLIPPNFIQNFPHYAPPTMSQIVPAVQKRYDDDYTEDEIQVLETSGPAFQVPPSKQLAESDAKEPLLGESMTGHPLPPPTMETAQEIQADEDEERAPKALSPSGALPNNITPSDDDEEIDVGSAPLLTPQNVLPQQKKIRTQVEIEKKKLRMKAYREKKRREKEEAKRRENGGIPGTSSGLMEDEDYAAFCSIFRSLPPSSPPKEALRMDPNLSSQLDDGLKILARAAGVNRGEDQAEQPGEELVNSTHHAPTKKCRNSVMSDDSEEDRLVIAESEDAQSSSKSSSDPVDDDDEVDVTTVDDEDANEMKDPSSPIASETQKRRRSILSDEERIAHRKAAAKRYSEKKRAKMLASGELSVKAAKPPPAKRRKSDVEEVGREASSEDAPPPGYDPRSIAVAVGQRRRSSILSTLSNPLFVTIPESAPYTLPPHAESHSPDHIRFSLETPSPSPRYPPDLI